MPWGTFFKWGAGSNPPVRAALEVEDTTKSAKATTPRATRAVPKKGPVFRVAGIPPAGKTEVPEDTIRILESSFSEAFPEEKFDIEATLTRSCYGSTRTALVSFTPSAPPELSGLANGGTYEIPYKNGTRNAFLIIDKDFYGLTQLYETVGFIRADIVAVPGLNGHAYGSWRGRNNLQMMWLRDFLEKDLPQCRVMIYGYNSKLSSNSTHTIPDYTDSFLEELQKARESEQERNRPIVFIGHSFGGVIIAQSIVKAKDDPNIHGPLFEKTRATIFFGTPHRGLIVDDMLAMLELDSPRKELVLSLSNASNNLGSELKRFINYTSRTNLKIVSFKEIHQTRKLKRDENGVWSRSGEYFMAVDSGSSVLQLPDTIEESLSVEGDHSTMVKFENNHDKTYTSVVRHLKKFVLDGSAVAQINGEQFPTACSAVIGKSASSIERILRETPSVANTRQMNGTTTLLHLAVETGNEDIVYCLLRYQANIEAVNERMETPFHLAARKGFGELAGLLLKNGAKVDDPCKGMTALQLAAESGHSNMVEFLLDNGAYIAATDDKKRTALHLAALGGHTDVVTKLLEKGANPLFADVNGFTALHMACKGEYECHDKVVEALLKHGANIEATTSTGCTALYLAAQNGHRIKIIEFLLKKGANIHATVDSGHAALETAAYNGHQEAVELLIKSGANVHLKTKLGNTALNLASYRGHTSVVDILLKNGANIHAANDSGRTALYFATENGHQEIVELLLKSKANVDAKIELGHTALHSAANKGHTSILEILLRNGANVHLATNTGYTALHCAANTGHTSIVEILLRNGANVDITISTGHTALHLAVIRGDTSVIEILLRDGASIEAASETGQTVLQCAIQKQHRSIIETLLQKGASIEAADNDGNRALYYAVSFRNAEIAELLLRSGANVDAANNAGFTALHHAAWEGYPDIAELLIKNKANVHAKNGTGQMPLHSAASYGHINIIEILLKNGANIDAANDNGYTVLHDAASQGNVAVFEFLLKNNASIAPITGSGYYVLHLAAQYGHQRIVELLIQHGVYTFAVTTTGHTAIALASQNGHNNVVQILLANSFQAGFFNSFRGVS